MADPQVKNVPAALHDRLLHCAEKQRRSIDDIAQEALEHEVARLEGRERLAQRPATDLGGSAASLLEEERQNRAQEARRQSLLVSNRRSASEADRFIEQAADTRGWE
jgi:hypothetical protein